MTDERTQATPPPLEVEARPVARSGVQATLGALGLGRRLDVILGLIAAAIAPMLALLLLRFPMDEIVVGLVKHRHLNGTPVAGAPPHRMWRGSPSATARTTAFSKTRPPQRSIFQPLASPMHPGPGIALDSCHRNA